MKTYGIIEIQIKLYLCHDVTKEEARDIVENLDYEITHDAIDNTDLYDFEV